MELLQFYYSPSRDRVWYRKNDQWEESAGTDKKYCPPVIRHGTATGRNRIVEYNLSSSPRKTCVREISLQGQRSKTRCQNGEKDTKPFPRHSRVCMAFRPPVKRAIRGSWRRRFVSPRYKKAPSKTLGLQV